MMHVEGTAVVTPERKTSAIRTFWNQIGRHGAAYLVAEGIAKGSIYLLLLWLATTMQVDHFGLFNVFLALIVMVAFIAGLGLPDALVRFHFLEMDFRAGLTLATLLPLATGLLLLAAVTPWLQPIAMFLNVPPVLVILAIAGAPLVALRQGWLGVLRARRESGRFVLMRVLEPLLFAAALMMLARMTGRITYLGSAAAYVAAVGGVAAVGLAVMSLRIGMRWSVAPLRSMLLFSIPLVAHGLAMTGLSLFDHLVLQQLIGSVATGIYAFAYRFGMAMSLVVFAFGAAWGPLVLERLRTGREATLRPLSIIAFRLLLLSCIILAWILPAAAEMIAAGSYSGALHLIPIVVYSYLWAGLYSFAGGYLYFRDRSARLAVVSGTAFLINVGLNYLTIPSWGATAAAVTTLASYIMLTLLIWHAVGADHTTLPWRRFAVQAALAGPVILAAVALYR